MAWIVDSNFGSTLYAVPAVAPFTTGGGNRIISLDGLGVIYNDSSSVVDSHISYDFINHPTYKRLETASYLFGFIARRQASGNFYFGGMSTDNNGTKNLFYLFRYTASSNTFSQIAANEILEATPLLDSAIHTLAFRVQGRNLSVLFDGEVRIAMQDSNITAAGNMGLAVLSRSGLPGSVPPNLLADNFTAKNL